MKNIAIVFILFFCFSTIVIGQKRQKLKPVQDSVYRNSLNTRGKSYPINAYIGKPKLTIPDMLFFNPYDEWKIYVERRAILSKSQYEKKNTLDLYSERFYLNEGSHFDLSKYFQPFYFRKSEVMNKEYREFVHWVRDSIAHDLIGNYINFCDAVTEPFQMMDWDMEIDWTDPALEEMFIIDSSRWGNPRKDYNYNLFVYNYRDKSGKEISVPIYPDTIYWAAYYYGQPYLGLYFQHPGLDHHPVININYHQAIAFCHWKEKMLRKELREKGFKYDIEVGLPTVYEWEWIATSKSIGNGFLNKIQDESWNTDLLIEQEDGEILMKETKEDSYFNRVQQPIYSSYYTDFAIGFEGKEPKKFNIKKENFDEYAYYRLLATDENGVYHMGDNVSEWIAYNYQDGWDKAFQRHIERLEIDGSEAALLVRQIALYYDSLNDKYGQLVYGSNWLDRRYSYVQGKNKEGIFAKRFVNPDEAHSTLGFRYVVRIKKKN